jgi:cobalt-zinc-cadmium efflux system protein
MSVPEVSAALSSHPLVVNVHDFHLWEITSGMPALSAHVMVRANEDCHEVRRELEQTLRHRFGIAHTTLQVDHVGDPAGPRLLEVQPLGQDHHQEPAG